MSGDLSGFSLVVVVAQVFLRVLGQDVEVLDGVQADFET